MSMITLADGALRRLMKKCVVISLSFWIFACSFFPNKIEVAPQTLPNAKLNMHYMAEVRFLDPVPLICHLNITSDVGLQIMPIEEYDASSQAYPNHCFQGFLVFGVPNKTGVIHISAIGSSNGLGGPMTMFIQPDTLSFSTTITIEP